MNKQRFKSVRDAIEDTPGDAANMKAQQSCIMARIDKRAVAPVSKAHICAWEHADLFTMMHQKLGWHHE